MNSGGLISRSRARVPLSLRARLLLSLLAGFSYPLAFSPFEWSWVALLSMGAMFSLWRVCTRQSLFWSGYIFGLGQFGAGIYWIYISIHDFGHVSLGLSIFLCVLFVAFLSLFPGSSAWLFGTLRRRSPGPVWDVLSFAVAWVMLEWIRGWFLTGFPWLVAGYSQTGGHLAGVAPIFGVYGLSLLLALSAALGVTVLIAGRRAWRYLLPLLLLQVLGPVLGQVSWTEPVGGAIRVSLVQGNISQDIKWLPEMREPTLELYRRLTEGIDETDLVIWPESAVPMFLDEAKPYLDDLGRYMRNRDADLLTGIIAEDRHTGRYYNTVIGLGDHQGLYAKHHLVPFTEYLPLKTLLGGIVSFMQVPMSNFSGGGRGQAPLNAAGVQLGVSICYEDAFGEEMIDRLPDANVLVNVSNDAWFGGSIAPWQHLQMARMRALETGRPMLRATNTGITAIVGHDGGVVATAPAFKAIVLNGEVQPRKGMPPYGQWGNWPVVSLMALVALIMLWPGFRVAGIGRDAL